jgi:hypothetical protein
MDAIVYRIRWDKVLYSDEIDLFAARDTAFEWHGGQWSPFYSFASTECTVWSEDHRAQCIAECEACLRIVEKNPGEYSDEPEALENLRAAILALPAKG